MKKLFLLSGLILMVLVLGTCDLGDPVSQFDVIPPQLGTAQWARSVSGGANTVFFGTTVDSEGNIYAFGYQEGTKTCGYGNNVTAKGSSWDTNAVIVKYNSNGEAQWARTTTSGSKDSRFTGVAVNSSGVYAAGVQGSGYLNYGSGTVRGPSSGNEAANAVIVKYSADDGTAQWARVPVSGDGDSRFAEVAASSSGVYVAGSQAGGNFDYGNGTSVSGPSSGDEARNAVIVKYSADDGTAQWARVPLSGNNSVFNSVAVDSSGVCVTGVQNSGNFDYGSGNVSGPSSGDKALNAVIVKYGADDGTAQWARAPVSGYKSVFYGVTANPSGVYVTGIQMDNAVFDYGNSVVVRGPSSVFNAVIVKYSADDGTAQWAQTPRAGSVSSVFNGLASDSSSNIYAVGAQFGSETFDYGNNVTARGYGDSNAVIVKYRPE